MPSRVSTPTPGEAPGSPSGFYLVSHGGTSGSGCGFSNVFVFVLWIINCHSFVVSHVSSSRPQLFLSSFIMVARKRWPLFIRRAGKTGGMARGCFKLLELSSGVRLRRILSLLVRVRRIT